MHYAVVITILVSALLASAGAARALVSLITHALESTYGWTRAEVSGSNALSIVLYGLVGPFVAALMDRFGMRVMVLGALVLASLTLLATSFLSSLVHLYLLQGLCMGCASGVLAPTLGKVVLNRWFAAKNGIVMGLFSASAQTGSVIFAPIMGFLAQKYGWQAPVWLMFALLSAFLLPTALCMKESPESIGVLPMGAVPSPLPPAPVPCAADDAVPEMAIAALEAEPVSSPLSSPLSPRLSPPLSSPLSPPLSSPLASPEAAPVTPPPRPATLKQSLLLPLLHLRSVSLDRNFWILAGSFFVCGLSTNGLIATHLVPACIDHGMQEVESSSFLSAIGVFDIAGTVASGWLTDRFDSRILLMIYYGFRGAALIFLPFAFEYQRAGLWPFAVLYGLDWIATVPPTAALCTLCFGKEKSAVLFGWCLTAHQVGACVAAAGAGVLRVELSTYTHAFLISGGICFIAAMAVLGITPTHKQQAQGPQVVSPVMNPVADMLGAVIIPTEEVLGLPVAPVGSDKTAGESEDEGITDLPAALPGQALHVPLQESV